LAREHILKTPHKTAFERVTREINILASQNPWEKIIEKGGRNFYLKGTGKRKLGSNDRFVAKNFQAVEGTQNLNQRGFRRDGLGAGEPRKGAFTAQIILLSQTWFEKERGGRRGTCFF